MLHFTKKENDNSSHQYHMLLKKKQKNYWTLSDQHMLFSNTRVFLQIKRRSNLCLCCSLYFMSSDFSEPTMMI